MAEKVKKYAFIILVLEILLLTYQIFSLDIKFFNYIMNMLNDASTFITVICVLFIFVSLYKVPRKLGSILLSIADIILAQRLYSNDRLKSIVIWIKGLDIVSIIFYIVAIAVIVSILYITINQRAKKQIIGNAEESDTPSIIEDGSQDNNTEDGKMSGDKPKSHVGTKGRKHSFIEILVTIIFFLCLFIVFVCTIYYILVKGDLVKINEPKWINNTYLLFSAIIAASIVLSIVGSKFLYRLFASLRIGINIKEKAFRFSALAALILEIAFFIYPNILETTEITDFFLSAITENWFSAIFVVVFLFLILQIFCTIFLHFFGGIDNSEGDKIVQELKKYIIRIELKIVKISCGIVEGCINLFDFIPDFFDTIGIILLGKDEFNQDNSNCNNNKN